MRRYVTVTYSVTYRYMQRYRALHVTLKKNSDLKIANHYKKVRAFLHPNFLHEAAYNADFRHVAL